MIPFKDQYVAQTDNTRIDRTNIQYQEQPDRRWVQQGDFLVNTETGDRKINALPLERIYPEFDLLTLGRSAFRKTPKETPVELPINENAYYRQITDNTPNSSRFGAIADLRRSGVVRTTPETSIFKTPMFSKGAVYDGRVGLKNSFVIKSKPNSSLKWSAVDNLGNPIDNPNAAAFTPLFNGKSNLAPISDFEIYEYLPVLGKYRRFNLQKPTFVPITGLNTLYNLSE